MAVVVKITAFVLDMMARLIWVPSIVIILAALVFAWNLADREPPFSVLSHDPVPVRAGKWNEIDVPVWRDLSRHCDATLSRFIIDSAGNGFEMSSDRTVTDQFIRTIEQTNPGRLRIALLLPPPRTSQTHGIASGPARLVTVLAYACNPSHSIWPIKVTATIWMRVEP